MKFRKKPIAVEATQWFKNGDHPEDNCRLLTDGEISDGEVVTPFITTYYQLHPQLDCCCSGCGKDMVSNPHGYIHTKEGGHLVCPGDWIITGELGERYPCKPDIFAATYEEAE